MSGGSSDIHESTRDRLRHVPLFAELEDEDLDRLAGLSRTFQLRRKDMLFGDGEPYRGMYVILSGLAVVYKLSGDGRMLILHVCRPGDSLAEDPMFEEPEARYPAHARVTRDSEVMFLPRETFLPFLKQHPEVAWELLRGFATRLRELSQQLEGVTLREVTVRLARYLVDELEKSGSRRESRPVVTLALAKGSLASYLGTVHETLSRSFARLIREKIVAVDGPRVTVLDPTRLERLV
jgi:CRP/FNR family transcriptional regulator, dissimilatory nitrate respiration regulator